MVAVKGVVHRPSLGHRVSWCGLAAAFALLLAGADLRATPPAGHGASATEYEVKAAFLFNFLKFVDWPRSAALTPQIRVLIVGSDPFGSLLDQVVAGRTVRGLPIVVERRGQADGPRNADLVFVGDQSQDGVRAVLAWVTGYPVLTVGEHEGFLRLGGAIRLKLVNRRVRFDVNVESAEAAGLKINPSLLQVADTVLWPSGE